MAERVLDEPTSSNTSTQKGRSGAAAPTTILTHVVLHGAYHRGQIATIVRGSGETPAYTDYIHCVRQGFVD